MNPTRNPQKTHLS